MDEQLKAFKDFQAFHESSKLASSMTKREAFAMAAMQGLLAYPGSVLSGSYHTNASADDAAKAAVMYAEALIEALKETP